MQHFWALRCFSITLSRWSQSLCLLHLGLSPCIWQDFLWFFWRQSFSLTNPSFPRMKSYHFPTKFSSGLWLLPVNIWLLRRSFIREDFQIHPVKLETAHSLTGYLSPLPVFIDQCVFFTPFLGLRLIANSAWNIHFPDEAEWLWCNPRGNSLKSSQKRHQI